MSDTNVRFISARDLPEAKSTKVDLLCVEDGGLKRFKYENAATSGGTYERISSLDEIEDGAKYILVSNGCNNSGAGGYQNGNYIMIPEEVLRSDGPSFRMGFALVDVKEAIGYDSVSDVKTFVVGHDQFEWIIRINGDGYIVGTNKGYITIMDTELFNTIAYLDTNNYPTLMIETNSHGFGFSNGECWLDLNRRGCVNGYDSNYETGFYIYKKVK